MEPNPRDPSGGDIAVFAAAVAHELRTPLAALSGEVELALRRERSAAAYRDALTRISTAVSELVDLTGDLMLLGDACDAQQVASKRARLRAVLTYVASRYASNVHVEVDIASGTTDFDIVGDEGLLTRAMTLVVEHAVRHRRDGACVRLCTLPDDESMEIGPVKLVVHAAPVGFWPHTWQFLVDPSGPADGATRHGAGPLRLKAADRIVHACGGALSLTSVDGSDAVQIQLRCTEVA